MDRPLSDIIKEGKSDTSSHIQRQEFLSLFHQPDIEFNFKDKLIEDLNETKPSSNDELFFDSLFEKFWNKRRIEGKALSQKGSFVIHFMKWAAILVVGLILGYFYNSLQKISSPVYYTSLAPKGSVSELFLPDGTQIYLNSGSQIRYAVYNVRGTREVFLSGEAFFDVAKINGKPFMVHTSAYDIKVTGTKFNVKAYPEEKEVSTTLEEGSVHITSSENLKLTNETAIKPGEQAVYNSESGEIRVAEVNTKLFTAWTDNKLVFVNMSLNDLKVLLERKYGVEIEVQDSGVLDYHYDGTLKNESILQVMEILKQTLPIKYQVVGQKIVISKK
jgi:ferric-dicitrate binding protein FerR (iron transport regulator)